MHKFDLTGRTAVVTGAAQGFGRAITERFLAVGRQGRHVGLGRRRTAEGRRQELSSLGTVHPVQVDVSNLDAVDAATADTIKALSQIDILVGNAGIAGPNHKIWEYPVDEWRKVIEINLFGIYYCNRAVVPHMIAQQLRPHREHRVGRRQGRQPERLGLQRVEGGGDCVHEIARQGTGRQEHRRQRRDAGGGQDPHLRSDDARVPQVHAVEDPARPVPRDRRARVAGHLAGLRGELVFDRLGLRHQRRPFVGTDGRRARRRAPDGPPRRPGVSSFSSGVRP